MKVYKEPEEFGVFEDILEERGGVVAIKPDLVSNCQLGIQG